MSGKTNELISWFRVSVDYCPEEYDVIVSSGEQVSAGLLAISLKKIGLNSRSWLGWQIPILLVKGSTIFKIKDINVNAIDITLKKEKIAVIADPKVFPHQVELLL